MTVYGANFKNAGTNPLQSFKNPSFPTVCAKQSTMLLYCVDPSFSTFIFCIRDLTTSKGLATVFAARDETSVAKNKRGTPPHNFPSGPKSPERESRSLISEVMPMAHALRRQALKTVAGAPRKRAGRPSSVAMREMQFPTPR
mmetsp:Transcript_17182/g.35869  ORF Transcript_17182/g.35869 Transcript_17182/m.35869 type:complete len:142 (+) Transcript_17182:321-746(+)